jgi:hypothetical protein
MEFVPYTYEQVAEDRWQVNQGTAFVGIRATEAEAQATVEQYNEQERAYLAGRMTWLHF